MGEHVLGLGVVACPGGSWGGGATAWADPLPLRTGGGSGGALAGARRGGLRRLAVGWRRVGGVGWQRLEHLAEEQRVLAEPLHGLDEKGKDRHVRRHALLDDVSARDLVLGGGDHLGESLVGLDRLAEQLGAGHEVGAVCGGVTARAAGSQGGAAAAGAEASWWRISRGAGGGAGRATYTRHT